MIWHGCGSDLLCCVFVWVSSFCVCGSTELYWDIGSSSSNTHSDIVVCMPPSHCFCCACSLFVGEIPLLPFVVCSLVRLFDLFPTILYLYYNQSQ